MKLSCEHAARLLSEKHDRRLSLWTRFVLRVHVLKCKMCQVYGTQLGIVNRVCNEAALHAEHKCPGEMSAARKQQMKDAVSRTE
jgi:hypothetical protein